MYYVTDYTEQTAEEIAKHFETITRQAVSAQVRKYRERGDSEMFDKITKAKQIYTAKKFAGELRANGKMYGVGDYGIGKWDSRNSHGGYQTWSLMLMRCYSEKVQEKATAYIGCTVDERFHNFQDFMNWADGQIGFRINDYELDKDLLVGGNRVYGPDTCVFLPSKVNLALLKNVKQRGAYPIGVHLCKTTGKFVAACRGHRIGSYSTPEDAFYAYKEVKEAYMQSLAEKHKDNLEVRAYEALVNYDVKITD
jgi:hypothetical protein